jgi:hypothetical protein
MRYLKDFEDINLCIIPKNIMINNIDYYCSIVYKNNSELQKKLEIVIFFLYFNLNLSQEV